MSFILDALQRAELERERAKGTVPGLQTRSVAATTVTRKGGAAVRHRWSLLALMIVLAIAAISIILWRTSPVSTPLAVSPLNSGPAAAPITVTTVAAAVVVSPETARDPSSLNPPSPLPAPVRAAPSKAQPATPVIAPTSAPKSALVSPPPPRLSPSAPLTPKATLPFLKDLPEALRAQIPPLSISGVVYSDNPAQRLLLLNGQVLTQGSRAAEDLVLDAINPRSSDFTFQGTRFKVGH